MQKEEFEAKKTELINNGWEPMMMHVNGWDSADGAIPPIPMSHMWEFGSDMHAGSFTQQEQVVTESITDCGTPSLGAVAWGSQNDMPQRIDHLVNALPYTAQGIAYLHDIILGLGPALMWHTAYYNKQTGKLEEVTIPYRHAGTWLSGRIALLRSEDPEANAMEIQELEAQKTLWIQKKPAIDEFLQDNDVLAWLDGLVQDYVKLGICFPTLLLSLGRYRDDAGNVIPWEPTIKRLDYIPDVVARLEQRDTKLRINYVYHSERWRQNNDLHVNPSEAVAYHTLWPKNILPKYRKMVKGASLVQPKRRPTFFCAPIMYADTVNGYYPWMPWWSIFTSKAYAMAASYLSDKAIARNNANSWGKMVFINNEYLRALYSEMGADTTQEKQAIRQQVWKNINQFLKDKQNNQKTICLDSVLGPDGKTMQHAIEVVDVPALSESNGMKEALEEVTSILFFGLGIQPGLVGAIPGKTTSNSGTYQRELTLLKQNQLSPVQQKFLRLLNTINVINDWDPDHFVWVIRQQVLTTLDRNPEGTEEKNSK